MLECTKRYNTLYKRIPNPKRLRQPSTIDVTITINFKTDVYICTLLIKKYVQQSILCTINILCVVPIYTR